MTKTLVVTNDFPPRPGGIQAFVHELALRQPPGSVVVYASDWPGAAEFDAAQPFPVVRHPTSLMLPTPRCARRAARSLGRERLRRGRGSARRRRSACSPRRCGAAGVGRVVASTHGHEAGWALLPGGAQPLRRIGDDSTSSPIWASTRASGSARARRRPRPRLARLPPGVDSEMFRPGVRRRRDPRRHGLAGRPVVVCVSRLVPRKGQDVLIRGLAGGPRAVPGHGAAARRRRAVPREAGAAGPSAASARVVFTGGVPWEELPAHYAAGDVFAMPCRTRRGGLDVEGLGIVYLEASATGLPVVAGNSGGAPDAVREGETGFVVPGRSVAAWRRPSPSC